MKTYSKKEIQEKIDSEQIYLDSLVLDLKACYDSVKDFRVDAITTDKAISKMKSINTSIAGAKRKIEKLNSELEKL